VFASILPGICVCFSANPSCIKKVCSTSASMMTGTVTFKQKTDNCNAKFGDLRAYGVRDKKVSSKVPYLESLTLISYSLCNDDD